MGHPKSCTHTHPKQTPQPENEMYNSKQENNDRNINKGQHISVIVTKLKINKNTSKCKSKLLMAFVTLGVRL